MSDTRNGPRPGDERDVPRLRVAYLLTQSAGGPADLCRHLAGALVDVGGIEVRIFGPLDPSGDADDALWISRTDITSKRDVNRIRRVGEDILSWDPDLVHAQDRRAGWAAALALSRRGRRRGPSLIHTYHGAPEGVSEAWVRGRRGAASPYARLVVAADRWVAASMDVTVTPSPATAEFLRRRVRLDPRRIRHIDNGVALPGVAPKGRSGKPRRLLFVGVLLERKGVQDLLQALAAVSAGPDAPELDIVGDGPHREALEKMTAALSLRSSVRFHGFCSDVRRFMDAADVLVLPSHIEQQPLVVAEGLAAGLPVVATDVGGVADMLRGTSEFERLVPPQDVVALTASLRSVLAHEQDDQAAQARFVIARERFSAEHCARRHAELYRAVSARAVAHPSLGGRTR